MPDGRQGASRGRLLHLLSRAYGTEVLGRGALDAALTLAELSDVPPSRDETLIFARKYLEPMVSADLGPRVADTLMAQLCEPPEGQELPSSKRGRPIARISARPAEPSASPASHCIALVDSDNYRRTTLARALVRDGFRVVIISSLPDVSEARREVDHIDVVVVEARHPNMQALVGALTSWSDGLGVVLCADDREARRALPANGVDRIEVQPPATTTGKLVEAARRLCRRGG